MSDNPLEGWRIQHLFRDDPMDDWSDADYLDDTIVPFNPADRIKELETEIAQLKPWAEFAYDASHDADCSGEFGYTCKCGLRELRANR